MNNFAINSCVKISKFFRIDLDSINIKKRLLLVFIFLFIGFNYSFSQCPDHTTNICDGQKVTVDVDTLPFCDEGGTGIEGDISQNLDCEDSSGLNCFEFKFFRSVNSATESFTFDVGQGQGCTGELDASYFVYNGVTCAPLSSGGSQTNITFDFPLGINEIYIYLCINSNAQVTMCDVCRERPPCTVNVACQELDDIFGNYCEGDPCNIPVPTTIVSDVFVQNEVCDFEVIMESTDSGETDCVDSNGNNQINVIRTYTLKYFDVGINDFITIQTCQQNITLSEENCCVLPSLTTNDSSICAENQSSVDLSSLVTSNGTVSYYTSQNDADNANNPLIDTNVSPLIQTVYYVRSEVDQDCYVTDTITISINALPDASASGGELTCTILNIQLFGNSTTSGVTYSWVGPSLFSSNDQNPIVNEIGTYTLTVTETATGCTSTVNAEVTSDDNSPIADAGSDAELTCTTLEVTLDGSGSSTNPDADLSYEWSGPNSYSANTEDITVSATGVYTLTVTDNDNGCFAMSSAEVTSDDNSPTADAGSDAELTCTTLEVTLDGSGSSTNPDADLSYEWSGPNSYSANTEDITVSAIGVYTLTVTDNDNGCFATSSAEVTSDENSPIADAGPDAELTCTTTEVTLDGSGSSTNPDADLSYEWSGPNSYSANTEDITVSAIGVYTLTVTDNDNGCFAMSSAEVTEDKIAPTADAGSDAELTCTTLEVTLDGSGSSTNPDADLSYEWSGPNSYSANTEDITVSAIGVYTLTVTDNDNGCFATSSAEVTSDENSPTADAGSDAELTCTTTEVTLDGSGSSTNPDADLSYSWTGPNAYSANTEDITVSAIGVYILTVTDNDNGCFAMSSAEVTSDDNSPTADAGSDAELTCTTTEVTLDGSGSSTNPDADLLYSWSGPNAYSANTEDITVSAIGVYILTVTDNDNGCFATSSAEVTSDDNSPTADAGSDAELTCTTLEVTLDGSGSSTNPDADLSYEWSGPNSYSANTEDITVSATGVYTLTVTDNDNGCFAMSSAEVTEDKIAPTADAGSDAELTCTTLEVTLDGSGSSTNPDADLSYEWSGPNSYSANTEDITVSATGVYTLTVTDNDNGCFAMSSAEVTEDKIAPTADAGSDAELTCTTLEVTLDGSGSSTNPDADLSYEWSGPNSYSANTEDITVSATGVYTLTVTDNDNGCFAMSSAEVTEDKIAPTADAGSDAELTCTTLEVTLDGSGSSTNPDADLSYEWSGPNSYSANTEDITVSATGVYTLTVTDNDNGCFAMSSAEVIEDTEAPEVSIIPVDPICIDTNSIQLIGTPEGGIWSGDVDVNGVFNPINGSGSATYSFVGENGCENNDTIFISVTPLSEITIDDIICAENYGTYVVNVTVTDGEVTTNFGDVIYNGNNSWTIFNIPNDQDIIIYTTTANLECISTANVSAPECTCIELTLIAADVTCFGLDDGTILVDFVSDGAIVTVNGELYDSDAVYEPGTYIIVAYFEGNSNPDCIITQEVVVDEPVAVDIVVSSTNVTCNGAADGTITIESLSEGAFYTIKKNGYGADLSGQSFFGPGVYIVEALLIANSSSSRIDERVNLEMYSRINNPCADAVIVEIKEPNELSCKMTSGNKSNLIKCKDTDNNFISVEGHGGTGIISYSWEIYVGEDHLWSILSGANSSTMYFNAGIGVGAFKVTLTDENGCISTCFYKLKSTCGKGDFTRFKTFDFEMHPNPTKGNLNIKFDEQIDSNVVLEVYNVIGTLMYSKSYIELASSGIKIDLSELPSQVYYLKVSTKNGTKIKKVILE